MFSFLPCSSDGAEFRGLPLREESHEPFEILNTAGLTRVQANRFSDLLLHHMGSGLNDGITQGNAGPDQFRTAPLWGLGQRLFFLYNGRTSDLRKAIGDHAGSGSAANQVIFMFRALSEKDKQDLLNFQRSL